MRPIPALIRPPQALHPHAELRPAYALQPGGLTFPINKWYVTDQILHNGSTTAGNGVTFYTLLIYDFTR